MFIPDLLFEKLRAVQPFQAQELALAQQEWALESGLWTEARGVRVPIRLASAPWFLTNEQYRYLQRASWLLRCCLRRLTTLWFIDATARELMPLSAVELACFKQFGQPDDLPEERLFCRLDALCRFNSERWTDTLRFLETNVVGIGGMTYAPAAIEVLERFWGKLELQDFSITPLPDPRGLLANELSEHSAGRVLNGKLSVALLDDQSQYRLGGEMGRLKSYLCSLGINAQVCDIEELEFDQKDRLVADGQPVDLIYRFVELRDLLESVEHSKPLRTLQKAFQRGLVVPSLAGDLDHKSTFELLTSTDFLHHFPTESLEILTAHVPWTRLLFPRYTSCRRQKKIDLFEYSEANRTRLVLKPNRGCGGEKVLLGQEATDSEWRAALNEAATHPRCFVVQEMVEPVRLDLPCLQSSGEIEWEQRYLSLGLFPTASQMGALGRFSSGTVVNIAQSGGVVALALEEDEN